VQRVSENKRLLGHENMTQPGMKRKKAVKVGGKADQGIEDNGNLMDIRQS